LTSVSLRDNVLAVSTNTSDDDDFPAVTYVLRCIPAATESGCAWRQEARIPAIDQLGDEAADAYVGDGALAVRNDQDATVDLYVHRPRGGGYGAAWTKADASIQGAQPAAISDTHIIFQDGNDVCAMPYTPTRASDWTNTICFAGHTLGPFPLPPRRIAVDGNRILLGNASFSSPVGIYASLVTLATDCNSNGVLDECDIADGVSFDCNSNGLADECDILAVNPDGRAGMDASDFAFVADCFDGTCGDDVCIPSVYEDACCELADWDTDGDVDLVDYAAFQSSADRRVELDCNFNGIADSAEASPGEFFGYGVLSNDEMTQLVSFCILGACPEGTCNPPVYPDACCLLADTDLDGDVDLRDFALFQAAFNDN